MVNPKTWPLCTARIIRTITKNLKMGLWTNKVETQFGLIITVRVSVIVFRNIFFQFKAESFVIVPFRCPVIRTSPCFIHHCFSWSVTCVSMCFIRTVSAYWFHISGPLNWNNNPLTSQIIYFLLNNPYFIGMIWCCIVSWLVICKTEK